MDWQAFSVFVGFWFGFLGGLHMATGRCKRDPNYTVAGAIVTALGLGCLYAAATLF